MSETRMETDPQVDPTGMNLWSILQKAEAISPEGHYQITSVLHTSQVIWPHLVMQHASTYAREVAHALFERFSDCSVTHVLSPSPSGQVLGFLIAECFGVKALYARPDASGRYQTLYPGFQIGRGSNVLVVDDGIYTGRTLADLQGLVRSCSASCVGVGVIIDRRISDEEIAARFEALVRIEVKVYRVRDPFSHDGCTLCARLSAAEGRLERATHAAVRRELEREIDSLRVKDDLTFD